MTAEQPVLCTLLAKTALGDRNAFKQLYDETSPQLLGLLISMLKHRDVAEDVLQDTFLKVWHRAGDYHADRGQVTTWMSSIARYRALDILRAQGVRRKRDQQQDPTEPLTTELAFALPETDSEVGAGDRLQDCIHELSEDQRQSIGLAFYRGFTHEELSAQLEVPLGTVKAWIRRGLQQLRRCLEA